MNWDRVDICEAYYLFACDWHRGKHSAEYAIFGRLHRMRFRPSPLLSKDSLTENARCILARLIRRARAGKRTVRPPVVRRVRMTVADVMNDPRRIEYR